MSAFKVWLSTDDESSDVDAIDVRDAAEKQADYDHRQRNGWEWSWPVTYMVQDANGETFTVEVDRRVHPVFVGGRPKAAP